MKKQKLVLNKNQKAEILRLKEQISRGEFTYENINCPVCSSNKKTIISEYDRYGLPYKSNLCKGCGLIYTSPRFDQESYIKFYDNNYRKIYKSLDNQTNEQFFQSQVNKGRTILNFILKNEQLHNINSVLEVGCGMGGILVPFKEKGKNVYGVDYGSEYASYGKSKGLNITIGGLYSAKEDIKYDLIIYCHVFEHILDLNNELYEIKKRLNNNGLLYIESPGIKNLGNYRYDTNRYLQNAHTYNFSLTTLNNVLNKNGFDLVCGNEVVKAIFIKSINSECIQNDYEDILKKLEEYKLLKNIWFLTFKGVRELIIIFLRKSKLYKHAILIRNAFLKGLYN